MGVIMPNINSESATTVSTSNNNRSVPAEAMAAVYSDPVLGFWSASTATMNNVSSGFIDSGCDGVYNNCTNDSAIITTPENETTDGQQQWYMSSLGVMLAMPEWEAALTATVLSLIIVMTLVGNALVIMSVFTYRPLRSAPNFFIVSLAVADMTVAILVLPLNVAYSILGRWVLGKVVCEFWVTSDVLCCTGNDYYYGYYYYYHPSTASIIHIHDQLVRYRHRHYDTLAGQHCCARKGDN